MIYRLRSQLSALYRKNTVKSRVLEENRERGKRKFGKESDRQTGEIFLKGYMMGKKPNMVRKKCTKTAEKNWIESHNKQFLKKIVDFL